MPAENTNFGHACAYFRLAGIREGFTELEVSFESNEFNEGSIKSSTRFSVAAYRDIEFLADEEIIAVAVGSSYPIAVSNESSGYLVYFLSWCLPIAFFFLHKTTKLTCIKETLIPS